MSAFDSAAFSTSAFDESAFSFDASSSTNRATPTARRRRRIAAMIWRLFRGR